MGLKKKKNHTTAVKWNTFINIKGYIFINAIMWKKLKIITVNKRDMTEKGAHSDCFHLYKILENKI